MEQTQNIIGSLYTLGEMIGSGGGGDVFLATHTRLQKQVVIKRVKATIRGKIDERGEANILKNLKHTYLPQVYDFFYENGEIYTVFDFIKGSDFKKLLDSGKCFKQQDVVKWGAQLAKALRYLHTQKPPIIHGDIKPANIMLDENGNIALIDFNISMVMEGESAAIMGLSAGYSSPEHYRPAEFAEPVSLPSKRTIEKTEFLQDDDSEKTEFLQDDDPEKTEFLQEDDPEATEHVTEPQFSISSSSQRRSGFVADERSDIYSLGATLYHMLTGERPAIAATDIKPLIGFKLDLGESIVFIVEKCMAADPSMRFQTAEQLVKAFENIHKLDSRWLKQSIRQIAVTVTLIVLLAASALSTVYGYRRIISEKDARYNELVLSIADSGETPYLEAIELFPDRIAAYLAYAMALRENEKFDDCISFIDKTDAHFSVFPLEDSDIKTLGDIYFIGGNCYFEKEDYPNAVAYFEAAIKCNSENRAFYIDYAIALARYGRADEAASFLDKIDSSDIGLLQLLQGEIAFARQNYSEAVSYFKNAVSNLDDDDKLYRAYITCDKAYQRLPELTDEHIKLLKSAVVQLPARRILKNLLADELYRAECYDEAVEIYEDLRKSGYVTFGIMQNIGLLYDQNKEYDKAQEVFEQMLADYPDDYRVPMQLAFIEIKIQYELPNESRNYKKAVEWYEAALKLFNKNSANADNTDMAMLAGAIEDLRSGGWIN